MTRGPVAGITQTIFCVLIALVTVMTGGCNRTEERWNVLVVVTDTVRADHLSINGYDRPTSPALDALAREGANFTDAVTAAPRTWQSFSSMLTGLYPVHHGVRHIFDRPLQPTTPTLGSTLGKAGYETSAFESPLLFIKKMTAGAGFHRYVARENGAPGAGADAALLDLVWKWISRERDAPFLAFVSLPGAHWPYTTNKWTGEFATCEGQDHSFNQGSYGIGFGNLGRDIELRDADARRKLMWDVNENDKMHQHMIAHYDAEIRASDAIIGHLIDRMRESGLLERTIVVMTADHGESFGEHGYLQHGPRVDEPVMHVPLLIRLPKGHPAFNPGRTVGALVRLVDLFPTILDATSVPIPEGLDGVSLLPAIRGEQLPALWAYGEAGSSFMAVDPELYLPGVAGKHRMIRTAGWKLVFIPKKGGGEYRLFDLKADPDERHSVANDHPELLARLKGHLEPLLRSEVDRGKERELSPEEIETLRGLGYVQ